MYELNFRNVECVCALNFLSKNILQRIFFEKPEIDFSRPVNCYVAGINADIIIHAYYIKWKLRNFLGKSPKYHFSMISFLYTLDTRKNDAYRERRLKGLENKMRVVKGLPQAT